MAPTTPEELRAAQQHNWDAAAKGWWTWWPRLEKFSEPVTRRMLELADVTEGMRVLDVATGVGEPGLSAARAVGPDGSVVATDVSEAMLDIARQRAADAALTNIQLVHGDERLTDIEGPFDAVLCRWGIMFFGDVPAFLGRARALLRPGGRLALAVWASPQQVPMASAFAAAAEVLDTPPPAPDAPTPFRFADVDALAALVTGAGFADVTRDTVTAQYQFDSAEMFTDFMRDVAAPIQAQIAQQPEKADEVWAAVADAARAYEGDGGVVMANTVPVLAATTP